MSKEAADAFLDRLANDAALQVELERLHGDPDAAYAYVRDAGFDVQPGEILEAFTDRYGVELTPEQLDAIAAGDSTTDMAIGASIGASLGASISGTLGIGHAAAAVLAGI